MREIKFRVWDKQAKEYIDRDSNVIGFDGEVSEIECGDVVQYAIQENYVLEQYTGLNDKNGVEIYEGDIVKVVSQYWGQLGNKYEVTFESGSFLVPTTTLYDIKKSVEVIGNIHENADLLEEQ